MTSLVMASASPTLIGSGKFIERLVGSAREQFVFE